MTGDRHMCIGLQAHGRFDDVSQGLVANCATRLPVSFQVTADDTLGRFIRDAGNRIGGALEHGRFHPEGIRRLWGLRPQDPPLYRVLVNVFPYFSETPFAGGRAVTSPPLEARRMEQDLSIVFVRRGTEDQIVLRGNPRLYERWELELHLTRLQELCEILAVGSVSATDAVDTIQFPTQREFDRIAAFADGASVNSPDSRPLIERIVEQARRTPQALAVCDAETQLTYRDLYRQSDDLVRWLRMIGAGAGAVVALNFERSVAMVVAILATLKSGAAYLPLDPMAPPERVRFMLSDASVQAVLTSHALQARLPKDGPTRRVVAETAAFCPTVDLASEPPSTCPEDVAYVIYTSGSTGIPKGARVCHSGFSNLIHWYVSEFGITSADRFLIASALGFDLTQKNVFAPLLLGAQIHLASEPFDPADIVRQIERDGITVLNLTPSAMYALADVAAQTGQLPAFRTLRYVFLGGEPINRERLCPLLRACPALQIVNTYGPTECSDVVAFHRMNRMSSVEPVPTGRPVYNTRLHVLDQNLHPVPAGWLGELHISGVAVGAGYLNQDELNTSRFVLAPELARAPGTTLYRSGDIVRWRGDGDLEFFGRTDDQVKVRGFRIELGEIETQLRRCTLVHDAVVLARGAESDERELVAFLACPQGAPDITDVRAHLERSLPLYMVPRLFCVLTALPLNAHEKVDRMALRALPVCAPDTSEDDEPLGEFEALLVNIWKEFLRVDQVGRHSNFFELGGHSLLAVRAVARIGTQLEMELPVRQLFDYPTPARFAESLVRMFDVSDTEAHAMESDAARARP
jgi:amino acid adenylation domain-containing protein